ncbi:putative clathrin assembly protein [Platanthera zijinensis]|uniref:Clathrin assembly protein n=1 Tax=Platanthera zijinensis TaxID=2320716 RepID=A0AAP0GC16_9ASPA
MASSSIDRAIGSVKDKTSIRLAKLGSSTTLAELEIVIFKATRHDEHPADEKHVHVILALTSYSRASITAGVALLARRLWKTCYEIGTGSAATVVRRESCNGILFEQ